MRKLQALVLLCCFQFCQAGYYKPNELPFLKKWYEDNQTLKTYLCSFPRSGNTWTRYCIEFLTKRPTLEKMGNRIHLYNCPLGISFKHLGTDLNKKPVWKMHTIDWFNNKFPAYYPESEHLILLLRNYKEVIPRHCGNLTVDMLKDSAHFQKYYFTNLRIYDSWHPEKRLLIYYEDLINNPEQTLIELLNFLGESTQYLNEFLLDYNTHKRKAIEIYQACNGTSVTKGDSTIHHSKQMSTLEKKQIDDYIKEAYPDLWNPYLSRYAEQTE
jgi:hypothetical protein